MENLFSPNPEILDIEKQSSKVIIKYSHLGEMFPMLPQGFYFLKNVFDRLCKTSGKLEKLHSELGASYALAFVDHIAAQFESQLAQLIMMVLQGLWQCFVRFNFNY